MVDALPLYPWIPIAASVALVLIILFLAAATSGFYGLLGVAIRGFRKSLFPQYIYVCDQGINALSMTRGISGAALLITAEGLRSHTLPTTMPLAFFDDLPQWTALLAHGTLWALTSLAVAAFFIALSAVFSYPKEKSKVNLTKISRGYSSSTRAPFLSLPLALTLTACGALAILYTLLTSHLLPQTTEPLEHAPDLGSLLLLAPVLLVGGMGLIFVMGMAVLGLPLAVAFHCRAADGHPTLPAVWSLCLIGFYVGRRSPEWAWILSTQPSPHLIAATIAGVTATTVVLVTSTVELTRLHTVHHIRPWTPAAVVQARHSVAADNPLPTPVRPFAWGKTTRRPQRHNPVWLNRYIHQARWRTSKKINTP